MKAKKEQWLICIAFCAFLGIMLGLFLALPKESYSEIEKKYLAEAPEISFENILSGNLDDELELYISEHLPGRDFFIGVNAYFSLLTGRQIASDIYLAQGGRLVEKPVSPDADNLAKKEEAIRNFAQTVGRSVDVMIIPSAGWAAQEQIRGIADPYEDAAILEGIYERLSGKVNPISVTELYCDRPDLYYRTDHHWTTEGAYQAYRAYLQSKHRTCREQTDFSVETVEGFYGSTYSRAALWLTKPDTLELWTGTENLQVTAQKPGSKVPVQHDGVFYRERLEEADKYTVYLDGNNSLVRIQNPNGKGKLLVIRDSYANCLGPLLAESYETVVLVDLRYFDIMKPVSQLCAEENFDDILICYSIGNFISDTNLTILR